MINQIFRMEVKPMSHMAMERTRVVRDGQMIGALPYLDRENQPKQKQKHQPIPRIPTTVKVLHVLQNSGKAWTTSEIAHDLGLTGAVICTALGRLVEAGEVERLTVRRKYSILFRAVKK